MSSLVEQFQQLHGGTTAHADASAVPLDAPSPAERFLAHHAAATLAMRDARERLIDAMRAIDSSDRHVLGQFLAVSRLLGKTDDLARPVSDFGLAAAARGRWPVAIEALAHSVRLDETIGDASLATDARRSHEIADAFAAAARAVGRTTQAPTRRPSRRQVALLVSTLDGPTAALLHGWADFAGEDAPPLRVYVTQSWIAPSAPTFDERTEPRLTTRTPAEADALAARLRDRGVEVWSAPAEADWAQRFRLIHERLVRDAIGALYIDASLSDAAAWMCAGARAVGRQIGLLRQGRSIGSAVDGLLDLDDAMHRGDRRPAVDPGLPIETLFQGVDVRVGQPADRAALGVPPSATLLLSISHDPDRALTSEFTHMVARALSEHRDAVYLVVGPGECDDQRAIFRAAGVHKRVGFAGDRRDAAALVAAADVYLAAPGDADRDAILAAMRSAKPVAILAGTCDPAGHARLVGEAHATTGNLQSLLERVTELLASPTLRRDAGAELAERAATRLSMEQTIRRWTVHCRESLGLPALDTQDAAISRVA